LRIGNFNFDNSGKGMHNECSECTSKHITQSTAPQGGPTRRHAIGATIASIVIAQGSSTHNTTRTLPKAIKNNKFDKNGIRAYFIGFPRTGYTSVTSGG